MSFSKDLEIARIKEQQFEQYIKNKYGVLTENSQDKEWFPDWDVKITGKTISTFEVKYNKCYEQNTVVIEIGRIVNGERTDTGLFLSKADYYIFTFECIDSWYMISSDKLKRLINETRSPERYLIRDKNNFLIQIFDKPFFLSHCRII